MLVFIVLFILGLAAFMAGIYYLQKALTALAQPKLKTYLLSIAAPPWKGFLSGTLLTAVMQSSSALTALLISMVNAGLLGFKESIGIILGTNVGTAITAQLFVLDLEMLAMPLLTGGFIVLLLSRRKNLIFLGMALAGSGLIFFGLWAMTAAVTPLESSPLFLKLLAAMGASPLLAVFTGIIVTAVIQSSSTVIAMTIVLARAGLLALSPAIALVMGSNLGTCMTAVIASLQGSRSGKQVALAHVLLNLLGIIIIMPLLDTFSTWMALSSAHLPRQIANAHLFYNLLSSLVILPFSYTFAKAVEMILPKR